APPEAEQEQLMLAVDLGARSTPPAMNAVGVPEPPPLGAASELPAGQVRGPARTTVQRLARDTRLRLLVGALLSLFLAFIPAHLISSVRESSRYGEIADEVKAEYAAWKKSGSLDEWHALDD